MSFKDFQEWVQDMCATTDGEWETNQCQLTLVNTHLHFEGEDIYCLISERKNNNKGFACTYDWYWS